MAKNTVESWDTNPANNTDIAGISIAEGCPAAGINDAERNMMSQIAVWRSAPKFGGDMDITGDILLSDSVPTVQFNSGGPRIVSPIANRLAFYNGGTANQRMGILPDGSVQIPGVRNIGAGDIQGSGNLKVFAASAGGVAINTYDIQDYTAVQFVRDVGGSAQQVGTISCTSTTTSYNTTSDERLKTNFRSFDSGSILDALWVGKFDWVAGGSGYGVRAQQAHTAFPDAVKVGDDDSPWQADYSKFVPLLLAEVKSLRARVAALEHA